MNETTDHDLDQLIRETIDRRELLADLDKLIITDMRRRARRASIRRWTRVLVFSFALPLVLLLFFACAFIYISEYGISNTTLLIMVFPTLALIYSTNHTLEIFSPDGL
ncbi:MAG: hypothetical protein J5486_07355 [Bacteroidaceae bacterium]|nr:hypothetical protein [Bacteroidaceae bacterium]